MRQSWPIFLHSSRTPAASAPGIAIAGPEGPCAPDGNADWIHGVLVLDLAEAPPGSREGWLRALFVTAVGHEEPVAYARNLAKGRQPYQDRAYECDLPGGGRGVALPFNFDLEDALGVPLTAMRYHLQVSARHHRSNGLTISFAKHAKGSSSEGPFPPDAPPQTAVDRLIHAYALVKAELHAQAADEFQAALQEPAVQTDLDCGNLYNAACAAGRSILADEGRDAERRFHQAIGWLHDDLALRRQLLALRSVEAFDAEVASGRPGEAGARLEALRDETVRHFRRARAEDQDLQAMHGVPAFEGLFAPGRH